MRIVAILVGIIVVFVGATLSPRSGDALARSAGNPGVELANAVEVLAPAPCKSVATFTSAAVPALQQNGCTGCHGGAGVAATAALDLSKIGKDDTAACSQALRKVNLANKPQSAIIQVPAGSRAHAGGKVTDPPAFTKAMLGWIANE